MIDYKKEYLDNLSKIESLKTSIEENKLLLKTQVKALWVLNKTKKTINDSIKNRIESVVTITLQSVFGNEYNFILEVDDSRNSINYIPFILKNGVQQSLDFGSGGGIVDIVSFAFRIALWALDVENQAPVFLFDEPAKNIGEFSNLDKLSDMIEFLSKEFNLQFIIVTHKTKLAIKANRIFALGKNAQISVYNSYFDYEKSIGIEND